MMLDSLPYVDGGMADEEQAQVQMLIQEEMKRMGGTVDYLAHLPPPPQMDFPVCFSPFFFFLSFPFFPFLSFLLPFPFTFPLSFLFSLFFPPFDRTTLFLRKNFQEFDWE